MALTTAGAQFIAKAITGLNSPTLFNSSNYYLGVGDSSSAFAVGQTDLQASTNKLRKLVTSVAESGGVVTAVASFGTSEANFEWYEIGSFNASSGVLMRSLISPRSLPSAIWNLARVSSASTRPAFIAGLRKYHRTHFWLRTAEKNHLPCDSKRSSRAM